MSTTRWLRRLFCNDDNATNSESGQPTPTTFMKLQAYGDGFKNFFFTLTTFGGMATAFAAWMYFDDLERTFGEEVNQYAACLVVPIAAGCAYAKYRADLAQSMKQQSPLVIRDTPINVNELPPVTWPQYAFSGIQLGLNVMVDGFGLYGVLQLLDFSRYGSNGDVNKYGLELTGALIVSNLILNAQSFINTTTSYRKSNRVRQENISINCQLEPLLLLQLGGDWLKTCLSAAYIISKLTTDIMHRFDIGDYPYDVQDENNSYLLTHMLPIAALLAGFETYCKYRANQNINMEELLESINISESDSDSEENKPLLGARFKNSRSTSLWSRIKNYAIGGTDALTDAATDCEIITTGKDVGLQLLAKSNSPIGGFSNKYSGFILAGIALFNVSTNLQTWKNDVVSLEHEQEDESEAQGYKYEQN